MAKKKKKQEAPKKKESAEEDKEESAAAGGRKKKLIIYGVTGAILFQVERETAPKSRKSPCNIPSRPWTEPNI